LKRVKLERGYNVVIRSGKRSATRSNLQLTRSQLLEGLKEESQIKDNEKKEGIRARSLTCSTGGVEGACWSFRIRTRKSDKPYSLTWICIKPTTKVVITHYAHFWCWDKPRATLDSLDSPRPGLGGSHHLPPYSILYVRPRHPHPNGFLSRDSQDGVPKLSWFGLLRLWKLITPRFDLRLRWGLKQTCSSPQELSNGVSHSTCTHQGRVDSRLLVVGSQTTNLTPGPSFDHNLCFRCLNDSCEEILDIYTSRPFQRYKKHLNVRCFDPCNWVLSFRESRRTPKSHFRECEWRPHTFLKVGLRQQPSASTYCKLFFTLPNDFGLSLGMVFESQVVQVCVCWKCDLIS
jgi:hypothetical protein